MHAATLHLLFVALIFFVLLSGFFSGSETGMMSLNRYRLRHLVRTKHRGAMRVSKLLARIDSLLGVILIGNTFANILASAIITLIAAHLFGQVGVVFATIILTLVILIFAEIIPKTVAATYPERVAILVSWPLKLLLKILYPVVWAANFIVSLVFKLIRFKVKKSVFEPLTSEELRTVVREASGKIHTDHREMLLSILDLESKVVEDVMIPRNEIVGIDIDKDWGKVLSQLTKSSHSHKIVYRGNLEKIIGVLHLTDVVDLVVNGRLSKTSLLKMVKEVPFVPVRASLTSQLLNFKRDESRIALVVDEYGDVEGLVSSADIVEQIIGKFAFERDMQAKIQTEVDGSIIIDAAVNIQDLNRLMSWKLPVSGPKTLNGALVEYLETIPDSAVCVDLSGYRMEVLDISGNMIKKVKIYPRS